MHLLTNIQRIGLAGFTLSLAMAAFSQSPYVPAGEVQPIRIWGHGHKGQDYILTLLRAWQDGFRATHPDARFDNDLDGNASAIGGLYNGTADLAILDREASFIEVDAYQQGTGYDLFGIPVARGSVSTRHQAPALAVYVNRANPLSHLSLQQLDGIFDADHRLSKQNYKTWGDLGLTGDWAAKPIQLYTYSIQSAEMQYFERAGLKGSQKFSCCLTLFKSKPDMTAEQQIAAALANDKYGLALSSQPAPGLKAIALSSTEDTSPVLPSAETITAGTYPLSRTIYIYVNRKPKFPVPANLAAFLEYIVSPEGQAVVTRTGGYLPLSDELAEKAREALQ
ncbi:MAG TPA: substrate-binding domain-containing protein [Terracidiphilus sp.]|nr:substrate-binding domain-containing protein [Terracidiphilus sp.]